LNQLISEGKLVFLLTPFFSPKLGYLVYMTEGVRYKEGDGQPSMVTKKKRRNGI